MATRLIVPCDGSGEPYEEEFDPTQEPGYEPPVEPVPMSISKRQFYQQLAIDGLITKAEALAMMTTGALPAEFDAMVSALPDDDEFNARMLLATNEYRRDNSFVAVFATAKGLSDAQIDAIWIDGAALLG